MTLSALDPQRARDLVSRLANHHVLIVGDVMLDRFIVGDVERMSPEAPVPVVRFRSEYTRTGGAANVASNVRALGGRAVLVGVVGDDRAASDLRVLLEAASIPTDGLVTDSTRPTVEKQRIVTGRNQQVARIDYEDDTDVGGPIERDLINRLDRLARDADVLLVSDYLKGAVTRGLMDRLNTFKTERKALLVDPKIPHLDRYAGATVVTPNQHEAEMATHRLIRSDDDARAAAVEFKRRVRCENVLMTRSEHGIWLSSAEAEGAIAAVAREIADVTGAGDTVVATLALALAAGATLVEASLLANYAAGVVIGKFGPATVTPGELLTQILSA
jgi:D-beta-D-heptose 7-phosphate kinase/D-beta-D-heptose 1-phosphate adenosyltransferase